MQAQGGLTIERMCHLGRVSRAGFYRYWQQQQPGEEAIELRAQIQQIVLAHRGHYGYRRVSRELNDHGVAVNHKRVLRLMQEDHLLAIRRRKFLMLTTDARHDLPVYLNLAARMQLNGLDQLWVADITYIRLREQFVYLAVILDAFSRLVVGWAVDDSLHAPLAMAALRKALQTRKPMAGLVHHSDRGIQYASKEYVMLLRDHGIAPSMSRSGNPYDNAKCESFIKTLKQEEIYTRQYRDLADLEAHMEQFLEQYYNRQRLHSALGYRSPEAFENLLQRPLLPAAQMSFFRHEEIYRCDGNASSGRTP
jgi:putative transposase